MFYTLLASRTRKLNKKNRRKSMGTRQGKFKSRSKNRCKLRPVDVRCRYMSVTNEDSTTQNFGQSLNSRLFISTSDSQNDEIAKDSIEKVISMNKNF